MGEVSVEALLTALISNLTFSTQAPRNGAVELPPLPLVDGTGLKEKLKHIFSIEAALATGAIQLTIELKS